MNGLIRTQVLLEKEQKRLASTLAMARGVSMGKIVRQALTKYLSDGAMSQKDREALIKKLAGCLANSPNWKNIDAVAWQRELRHEKGI